MDNKKDKKTVWIYAVVLFTSAFIVLMITAYSQIKVNKNIDDVKNKLGDTEKEKSNFQMNLSSALAENKKLSEKIESLENEIEEFKKEESRLKSELNTAQNSKDLKIENYEKLLLASLYYNNKDVKKCALIIFNEIDIEYLDNSALDMYMILSDISFEKAPLEFYNEGYNYFKKGNYENAIESFNNSLMFSKSKYFSDDCYYFIAYSYYYMNDKLKSKEAMNKLLIKYPDSTYKTDAIDFIKANLSD